MTKRTPRATTTRKGAAATGGRKAAVGKPATVEAYLAAQPAAHRATLARLRKTIRSIVPTAEECISYGMPGYRYQGKMLVWFGAASAHCAFYPGGVVSDCRDALEGYDVSKGTVRFPVGDALPASLVRALIQARIARIGPKKTAVKQASRSRATGARRPERRTRA